MSRMLGQDSLPLHTRLMTCHLQDVISYLELHDLLLFVSWAALIPASLMQGMSFIIRLGKKDCILRISPRVW